MPRRQSSAAGTALPAAPHLNLEYRRALARLRREAEDEIERLIAFLDEISPDPDLEDDELGEDDDPAEDDDPDVEVDAGPVDDLEEDSFYSATPGAPFYGAPQHERGAV